MATYQVQSPDGSIHAIEGPDGATQDQIMSQAQSLVPSTPPPTSVIGNADDASTLNRALHGAADPIYGIDQLVPHAIGYAASLGGNYPNSVSNFYEGDAHKLDNVVNQRERQYQADRKAADEDGFDAARMAGNILSPANIIVGGAVSKLPEATSVLGKAIQGFGSGVAYGATAPTDTSDGGSFEQGKGIQSLAGGVTGGILSGGGEAAASAIKPTISSNAQKLMAEGIRLTPGQILGGTAQKVEDAATSIPLLGDAIKSAQNTGYQDMNKAVANRALSPIGETLPDNINAGHDMVSYVKGKLGDAYDKLLPTMTAKVDPQFNDEIEKISGMAQTMPEQQSKRFENVLSQEVMSKISNNGSITGDSLKQMESALGQQAKGYMSDPNFDNRNLGQAFSSVQDSLRGMLTRSNPDQADQLQSINEGYANYAILRSAAASTGAGKNEGIFTPAQLNASVRSADKSMGKGQYAQGKALLQDLSGAAQSTLPPTVPDSGTAARAIVGAAGLGHFAPAALIPALAGSALYTKPGIALAQAILTKRPDAAAPLANAIRKVTSPVGLSQLVLGRSQGGN